MVPVKRMQLITKLPKTRRNKLLPLADNLFLHQRALVDTLHDPLNSGALHPMINQTHPDLPETTIANRPALGAWPA